MPDVRELGRKVKAKYPGVYDDLADDDLGRKVKAKYPGAYDDFTDAPTQPVRQPEQSTLGALGSGIAEKVGEFVFEPAVALAGAVGSATAGDFKPLGQMAESVGRGALKFASAFDPANPNETYAAVSAEQDPRLAELKAQQERRLLQGPVGEFLQRGRETFAAEAARDTSTTNKIARGVGRFAGAAAPAVVAGVLTGGSAPAMAATTALQSAGQPENLAASTLIGSAPLPVGQAFKAGVNTVRRVFGKGAAQIIEAEATPAAVAQVREAIGEVPPAVRATPPIAGETVPAVPEVAPVPSAPAPTTPPAPSAQPAALVTPATASANPTVERAMAQFDEAVQRINASNLTPRQKAIELEAAIQRIGQEASGQPPSPGVSAVPLSARRGYPNAVQEFPENPNPIQQAGVLPGEGQAPGALPDFNPPKIGDELEALTFEVKEAPDLPYTETLGPRVGEPLDALNVAVQDAAEAVPRSIGGRILDELAAIYHLPKTLKSSIDISAPFRQGSLLTVPPSQWGRAGRAGVRMFQAFKTSNFDRIKQEIAGHVDAGAADGAGLYLATKAGSGLQKAEEAFLSKYAGKIPLVKQSEQAYVTYLDSLRMDTFAKYKRVIDKSGLAPEQAQEAYKAAAKWINYATGRGSLGDKIDKAMPALNAVFFSPRYVASRLNVLNPVYYARNAATPAGRAVLKQQMGELVQYAGMVAGTMALAKAAGADVGLNPNSPDFLKIRFGNWRYDTLAGLQQVMRLFYRAGADITRKARGEKSEGPNALEIGASFLRSKLGPAPSVFTDFVKGRTVTGKPFSGTQAVVDLTAPLQWADFVEAYQAEGWGGVAKASPGVVGFGAQRYESTPVNDAVERARPLFTELQRLNKQVSDLRQIEGEPAEIFQKRVQQFSQNYTQFGQALLDSPRFKAASDDIKGKALDRLNARAKSITTQEFAFPALELDPNAIMDAVETSIQNKEELKRRRGF